jgi:hypothetical protein
VTHDVVGHGGPPAAQGRQLGHPGVADLHDGELGHHEEGVHQHQEEDPDDLDSGCVHMRRQTRPELPVNTGSSRCQASSADST